jgi:SAM-dependent methyltransferase
MRRHKPHMTTPEIFDRKLRRLRRDRAADRFDRHRFLIDAMTDSLLDRLDLVTRTFKRALVLGCYDGRLSSELAQRGIQAFNADAGFRFASASQAVQCEEDRLPFADRSFDLVVSPAGLDQVNDLPGALVLIRRSLAPDGLFLGSFAGAGSLSRLRAITMATDMATGGKATARFHPQIDVRSAGDLLSRAGFAMPVADSEALTVRYPSVFKMIDDLRGMAATNLLAGRERTGFSRQHIRALHAEFEAAAGADGRVNETMTLVFMSGWSPSPDQPGPARRGSANASLAAALKPKN